MPFLAAAANGLFADHGLDVEILEPAPGPENVRRVAAGGSDFCLTSVTHYLRARSQSGDLAARFVGAIVRRHPIAALVAEDSPYRAASELAGLRVAGSPDEGLAAEYEAGLRELGIAPSVLVPIPYSEAPAALGRGDIDVVADFADLVPRTRRQAGIPVRAVPLRLERYGSGLVAADRLPGDLVRRVQRAVADALERQRQDPKAGLDELARRYPAADPHDAAEGWSLVEPNIFTGLPPLMSEPSGWEVAIEFAARAHRLAAPPADSVYRPDVIGLS